MTTLIMLALAYGAGYITGHPDYTWSGMWDKVTRPFRGERR